MKRHPRKVNARYRSRAYWVKFAHCGAARSDRGRSYVQLARLGPLNEREKRSSQGGRGCCRRFESTRISEASCLGYREFFRQSYGLWMQALRAISAEGFASAAQELPNDYNARELPQTVRSALNDKGSMREEKDRVWSNAWDIVVGAGERIRTGGQSSDEMMKIPVGRLSDVSER